MNDPPLQHRRFGKYLLIEVLGKGANAHVFRAVQSGAMGFRKEVAVKQILPHVAGKESVVHGLINEARISGYLRHRNVVEVYEFDKVHDTYYLAMEYVPGFPLSAILGRSHQQSTPLPPPMIAALAAQMCDGLHCAHEACDENGRHLGMVHRDIKPGNVMLTFGGVVKVMDFGVVKAASNLFTTSSADVTKGTPIYMSPEQVRGRTLDRRSDLFSLGSVLAELITSQVTFLDDDLMAVLHMVDRAEIDHVLAAVEARMPPLVPVLRLALQRNPDDRFPSASEMGKAIRRACRERAEDEELGQWLMEFMDARPRPIQTVLPDHDLFADDPLISQMVTFQDLGHLLEDEEYDGPRQDDPSPHDTLRVDHLPLEGDTGQHDPVKAASLEVEAPGTPGPLRKVRHRRGPEMVQLPGGEFWMGSPDVEVGRSHDEALHKVRIRGPFLIGITPVTQDLWEGAMGDNPSWTLASDHPVESISWFQAVAFCNRLSEMEGLSPVYRIDGDDVSWDRGMAGFRLPSEAEWELAARAGGQTRFAGSDRSEEVAWHWRNTGGLTRPVAQRVPNGFGLFDLSGNVSEWVWDWYGPYPKGGDPQVDPHGPLYGEFRVHRGGSAFNLPADVRVARRHGEERPTDRYNFLGLRVARSAKEGG